MRVLVVGGTGMVGPGVVRGLAAAGHDVTVASRGVTRTPALPPVALEVVDRTDPQALGALVERLRPDGVVDLTCDDAATARLTVEAFRGVPRVVVASSVNAVGGPLTEPLTETTAPAPVSDYGRDKLAAEEVVRAAWRSGDSTAVIVRLGPVYRTGCHLDGQLAEDPYWLALARDGHPAVLADGGEALWNLLHADDAGRAITCLLESDAASATTVLVGSRHPLPWRALYRLVHRAAGLPWSEVSFPASRLREELGEPDFLLEMTMWDQRYDLAYLEQLAPGYEERAGRATVTDAALWLLRQPSLGDPRLVSVVAGLLAHGRTTAAGSRQDRPDG